MSRSARCALALGCLGLVVLGLVAGCRHETPDSVRATPPLSVVAGEPHPGAQLPTERPSPRYLTRTYRAPVHLVARGRGGVLSIPSLHVRVPVDAVGLDGTAMALPDDPSRVGWLRTTAAAGDAVGSSVISGHVSDSHDVPGALSSLEDVRTGAEIDWTEPGGTRHRFTVTALHRYPRTTGVPAEVFRTDGPHLLRVVTCTDRHATAGGGFHYASNLVVTARAAPGAG